jgi:hypothetical protein
MPWCADRTRGPFDEHVAVAEQRDEQQVDGAFLAHDHASHFAAQALNGLLQLGERNGGAEAGLGGCCGRGQFGMNVLGHGLMG